MRLVFFIQEASIRKRGSQLHKLQLPQTATLRCYVTRQRFSQPPSLVGCASCAVCPALTGASVIRYRNEFGPYWHSCSVEYAV
jgi:hypothetical protein